MRIAITGSNGSVGRSVVRAALAKKHHVIAIDLTYQPDVWHRFAMSPNYEFIEADLREYDKAFEAIKGCDAIVQLAGIPGPKDYLVETHNTNVVITWNVLRAAAEHGIKRYTQASSVNVVTLVWSLKPQFDYLPLDEDHPCRPDEPYGLSKIICEAQADTIVHRYPFMRISSLRLSWSVSDREAAKRGDPERRKNDLWGWVQEDSAAEAFLLALSDENTRWSGHERFFITAPDAAVDEDTQVLKDKYWPHVPVKEGKAHVLEQGYFDCSKAERILRWKHRAAPSKSSSLQEWAASLSERTEQTT